MALLTELLEHSAGLAAQRHAEGLGNVSTGAQNLSQGLGVIHNLVIQAQGSVSDDSGLIAALQTASRAPRQGSNDDPKA